MIKIICLGKIKESYLTSLIEDYKKRIAKYHKIDVIELKDENNLDIEKDNILKNIKKEEFVIALTIEGKMFSTEQIAKKKE